MRLLHFALVLAAASSLPSGAAAQAASSAPAAATAQRRPDFAARPPFASLSEAPPPGMHEASRPRWDLLGIGASVLTVTYAPMVGMAAGCTGRQECEERLALYVPVVGPTVWGATVASSATGPGAALAPIVALGGFALSLAQLGSVVAMSIALIHPQRTFVADAPKASARWTIEP